nr:unnamed protein product [Callosobruchus analis]
MNITHVFKAGIFCAEKVVEESTGLPNCVMALQNTKQKQCCVLDCPSNIVYKNCKFYKFPTDFDLCQKWKIALKLIGTISDEHYVCEAHFGNDDFVAGAGKPKSKKHLKKDAHPTLNLPREHTYMKFGNPKRGRVIDEKPEKKPTKIVDRRPAQRSAASSSSGPTASRASAPPLLPTVKMSKASPAPQVLNKPLHYAYVPRTGDSSNPWRLSDVTAIHQEQDPLALNYPTHTYPPKPDSTQETSTSLMLTQKILDEAIEKVDTVCKEIEDAITVNERFAAPSEPTEKITIQTLDSKVMELLLVKNNPKISNQVNDDFKTIDRLIDNAQAVLDNQTLMSTSIYPVHSKSTQTDIYLEQENRRLKAEVLSLKRN